VLSTVVRCVGHDAWAAVELEDLADWSALCEVLERPSLADGEEVTADQKQELARALQEWSAELTPMQVAIKLQNAGLAAAPVQSGEDIWRDPQLRARSAFIEVDHPDLGLIEHPQTPEYMTSTPGRVSGRSRRLGEDTVDVLGRWLQIDETARAGLVADGSVWQAPTT